MVNWLTLYYVISMTGLILAAAAVAIGSRDTERRHAALRVLAIVVGLAPAVAGLLVALAGPAGI